MTLVYILLIIIAIGVLLISTEGKELLGILGILALIAGGLYFGFWILMFGIAFITSGTASSFVSWILQVFFSLCAVVALFAVLGGLFYGGYRIIKPIKNKINEKLLKISPFWRIGLIMLSIFVFPILLIALIEYIAPL
jgi:hypothetical protein